LPRDDPGDDPSDNPGDDAGDDAADDPGAPCIAASKAPGAALPPGERSLARPHGARPRTRAG